MEVQIKCMHNLSMPAVIIVVFSTEYPAAYRFKRGPCRLCPTATGQKGRPFSKEYIRENSARCRCREEAFRRRCDLHEVSRVSLLILVIHSGFRLPYSIFVFFFNFLSLFFFYFRWKDIVGCRDSDGKTPVDNMIQKCPEAVTVR